MKHFRIVVFLTLIAIQPIRAGSFGEHKYIGDTAFKNFVLAHPEIAQLLLLLLQSEPLLLSSDSIPLCNKTPDSNQLCTRAQYLGQYPICIYKGKAITYGDLTGLSGDHSPAFLDTYKLFVKDSIFSPTGIFEKLFGKVICQYHTQLRKLDRGGRGYNPVNVEFMMLAYQDRSHFHIPATPLRQEIDAVGWNAYSAAKEILDSGLTGDSFTKSYRKKIMDLFETNSVAKYSILHMMARTYYVHVQDHLDKMKKNQVDADELLKKINSGDKSDASVKKHQRLLKMIRQHLVLAKEFMLLTLFTNAFSEHYLQDMFAGGHFFADRNAKDWLGLEAKGVHDFFGRQGLNTFAQGKSVTLKGDAQYTCEQLAMAVEANNASLEDLFKEVDPARPRQPQEDYLLMLLTPTEEPSSVFPALKKVPDVPLGEQFSSQRKSIGRSINGVYYGAYGLGSSNFLGGGIMGGLNYLWLTPSHRSPVESHVGFGPSILAEVTPDKKSDSRNARGRLGLGFNLMLYDWFYGNASIVSGWPVQLSGRFEGGIQIKPQKWSCGFRVGIVKYGSPVNPDPQLSVGIIHY